MSNRVVHFEVHADDIERARKFYQDIFGWEFTEWKDSPTPYYMVMTAPKGSTEPGINGGLLERPKGKFTENMPPNAFVCTIQVDNIDETIKKMENAGSKVCMAKFPIMGMAWQAYYTDSENNIVGLHQTDKNAK